MPTQLTLAKLTGFLEAEEIPFETDRMDDGVITFGIEGDVCPYDMAFDLDLEGGTLVCFTSPNPLFSIEEEQLNLAYEALVRINHGLVLGNFQLDPEDRILTYVQGVPIEEGDLSTSQLLTIVADAVEESDRYLPALEEILAGGDLEASIDRAETPPEGEG